MEQTKLDKAYDAIVNSKTVITKRTFLINGISNPEQIITLLQDNGTLKIVEEDKYQISSVEELYNYGLRLLKSNYQLKANLCFKKCYQINSTHRNTSLQIFLLAIKDKNYQKAYDILENILEIEPDKYQYDNNLYLYLLSILVKCPKKYESKLKSITSKSVISKANMNKDEISMRKAILNHHFPHAMYFLNNIHAKNLDYSIERNVLKELLSKVIDSEIEFKKHLTELVDNNQYTEIVSILEEKQQQQNLSAHDYAIYLLAKKIIEISKNKIIPYVTIEKTNNFYQAILGNNFSLAMQINNKFIKKNDKYSITIDKLLSELNKIIKEIKEYELSISTKAEESSQQLPSEKEFNYQQSEIKYTDKERKMMEDLAYYLKSIKLPFDVSCKKIGLMKEQALLIKLIYARDYYIEGNYDAGDKLIKEIELSFTLSEKVIYFINQIRKNRNNYQKETSVHTKKLTI